jgi:amino-acid N-acetyltransferase
VLGVKLVVVLGAKEGIDRTVRAAGGEVRYVHGQRVTDEATMQAAVQAAGTARMQFEARLSRVNT